MECSTVAPLIRQRPISASLTRLASGPRRHVCSRSGPAESKMMSADIQHRGDRFHAIHGGFSYPDLLSPYGAFKGAGRIRPFSPRETRSQEIHELTPRMSHGDSTWNWIQGIWHRGQFLPRNRIGGVQSESGDARRRDLFLCGMPCCTKNGRHERLGAGPPSNSVDRRE